MLLMSKLQIVVSFLALACQKCVLAGSSGSFEVCGVAREGDVLVECGAACLVHPHGLYLLWQSALPPPLPTQCTHLATAQQTLALASPAQQSTVSHLSSTWPLKMQAPAAHFAGLMT